RRDGRVRRPSPQPRQAPTKERFDKAEMTIALVYVRQSRHKDYERTVSPDVQREACAALPAGKACDRVEMLQDLDVSGGKLKGRKAFLSLLDRVRRGEVSVVAAYDQSRAFRNTR